MKLPLVSALLLLAPLAPSATAAAPACIDTGSQWRICVEDRCAIVDGPAFHAERCVALKDFCVETGSQWQACVDYPCVIVDGAAFHEEICLDRIAA